ncbi:MAG: biotin--[acetyl-CoA-carboxylase] ligase [Alphaproteobacteria bacterium]
MAQDLPRGFRRIAFESVGSTNDEAKRFAAAGASDGLIVTAGEQRAGRGRLGRDWSSPPGNLYASFVTRPDIPLRRAAEIAFVAAVAVHDTAHALAPSHDARCKWPNDLLVDGRKICGILAEATARPNGKTDFIVVGFGINVAHHPAESRWPATSFAALGLNASPDDVLAGLAAAFAHWRQAWETKGFEPIRAAWSQRSFEIGRTMSLNLGKGEIEGGFAGIDGNGGLLLDLAGGRRETISYGEVTRLEAR